MGNYTGLRCKVIIKPEYREEFKYLHEIDYEWEESNLDFLKSYGYYSRADFIPRGMLSYMPDSWEDTPVDSNGRKDWMRSTPTEGFDRNFDFDTGLWSFQCSLKNYDSTIQYFFENVLSVVTESVIHLEYYYEEAYNSYFYYLNDGQLIQRKEGIQYKSEPFENSWY